MHRFENNGETLELDCSFDYVIINNQKFLRKTKTTEDCPFCGSDTAYNSVRKQVVCINHECFASGPIESQQAEKWNQWASNRK